MNPVRLLRGRSSILPPASNDEVVEAAPPGVPVEQAGDSPDAVVFEPYRRRRRLPWPLLGFVLFFVLPSLATVVYFAAIAAPQYAAEARLVVRAAEINPDEKKNDSRAGGAAAPASGSATNMASSSSLKYSPTTQNAYIVAQYIRSRAMVEDLSKELDLREIFRRPEADFAARLKDDAPIEALVDYWEGMVHSYVDAPSGIVTFQVKAFRADDALKLAEAVIGLSEKLVNQISKRAREDIMRASEDEVREAAAHVRAALQHLQTARDAEGVLDPLKAADDAAKLLLQLTGEKIRIESDLFAALRTLDKDAPSVRHLRARLDIAEKQLAAFKATIAGNGGPARNLASSLRKFEELERKRFVADKLLLIAEEGLDRARQRAERQNLYFMVFVPPTKPMEAKFPQRLAYSIILPIAFLIFWGIGALVAAAIEDHRI